MFCRCVLSTIFLDIQQKILQRRRLGVRVGQEVGPLLPIHFETDSHSILYEIISDNAAAISLANTWCLWVVMHDWNETA